MPRIALPDNSFGVELEYLFNGHSHAHYRDRVQAALAASYPTVRCRVLSSVDRYDDYSQWIFKSDPSCGGELTSPPLTWATVGQLDVVTQAMVLAGAGINNNCGTHVHHHFPNLDDRALRRIWLLWCALEPAILGVLESPRRCNRYALPLTSDSYGGEGRYTWEDYRGRLFRPVRRFREYVEHDTRYRALNMTHWWRTARIEIRAHQGTLNSGDLRQWILLTQLILDAGSEYIRQSVLARMAAASLADKYRELLALVTGRCSHATAQELPVAVRTWLRDRNPTQAHFLEVAA